jgi:hypothetical protein
MSRLYICPASCCTWTPGNRHCKVSWCCIEPGGMARWRRGPVVMSSAQSNNLMAWNCGKHWDFHETCVELGFGAEGCHVAQISIHRKVLCDKGLPCIGEEQWSRSIWIFCMPRRGSWPATSVIGGNNARCSRAGHRSRTAWTCCKCRRGSTARWSRSRGAVMESVVKHLPCASKKLRYFETWDGLGRHSYIVKRQRQGSFHFRATASRKSRGDHITVIWNSWRCSRVRRLS